jgi:hypothetical protein
VTWRGPASWSVVIVLAVVFARLSTEGQMGVPPTVLGLVGLMSVVALLMWCAARLEVTGVTPSNRLLLGLTVLLLGLVAAQDFVRPGVTHGHDLGYHLWAIWSTWRCVLDGDFIPRWNPYLGLGMPLLQFYSPLSYVSAWPAQLLGASPVQALSSLMVLGQVLTALSALAALRWLGASYSASILASAVAVLAPYHLLDQTLRVALAENLALSLLPLLLAATWKLGCGRDPRASWILGLCAGALLLTHVLTLFAMLFVGAPVFLVAAHGARRRGERLSARFAALALCALMTMGATAAWWLPIVVEVEHTAVQRLSRPGRAISSLAATATEPVRRRAWQRYGIRYKIGEVDDPGRSMPLYFGCVLLGLLLLGLFAPRRSDSVLTEEQTPHPRLFALLGLLCVLLATWPAARVLDGVPLIGRIMFPWRLYGPASICAALAAGFALDRFAGGRVFWRRVLLGGTLVALAWDSSPYLGAPARYPDHHGQGPVVFAGQQALPIELPRDSFVRVEGLTLPPSDYEWNLAKSRRVFPEYMSVALRERYGKISKPPTIARSQGYHASYRVGRGSAGLQKLQPEPFVSFRARGSDYQGLTSAVVERAPERLLVTLPAGQQAGNIRLASAWFPGWMSRVDGGEWRRALRSESLLAVRVGEGERQVEFRYFVLRPWQRPVGLAITWLSFFLLLWSWFQSPRRVP